jgi:hypothetical protein
VLDEGARNDDLDGHPDARRHRKGNGRCNVSTAGFASCRCSVLVVNLCIHDTTVRCLISTGIFIAIGAPQRPKATAPSSTGPERSKAGLTARRRGSPLGAHAALSAHDCEGCAASHKERGQGHGGGRRIGADGFSVRQHLVDQRGGQLCDAKDVGLSKVWGAAVARGVHGLRKRKHHVHVLLLVVHHDVCQCTRKGKK